MPLTCKNPTELFWEKVQKTDNCWLWTASKLPFGYGKFSISIPGENRQRHVFAHRYAFELTYGRVPGLLRHSCDNPSCVNPSHLIEGTQADNRRDCVDRGREPRGEQKPNTVLTEELVSLIRKRVLAGETVRAVAKSLGIKEGTARNAWLRNSWKHVTD